MSFGPEKPTNSDIKEAQSVLPQIGEKEAKAEKIKTLTADLSSLRNTLVDLDPNNTTSLRGPSGPIGDKTIMIKGEMISLSFDEIDGSSIKDLDPNNVIEKLNFAKEVINKAIDGIKIKKEEDTRKKAEKDADEGLNDPGTFA